MNFESKSIIICNESTKRDILKKNSSERKIIDYTFISLEDFKKRYTYSIKKEGILHAMKKLSLSYKNTLSIIKDIYYITDDTNPYTHDVYQSDKKITELYELKKELKENKFLEYDNLFKDFIKGKKIYLVDQFLDLYTKKLFENIKGAEIIYVSEMKSGKTLRYKKFDKFNQEVEWVFNNILRFLKKGADINKIFIVSESKDYNHLLYRYSNLYHIPIHIKESESILNHEKVQRFLGKVLIEDIKDAILEVKENEYIYNQIVKIVNEFHFVKDKKILQEILETELSNVYYEDVIATNVLKVVDFEYHFSDDDLVYLVGFNNSRYPKTYKDEAYLSDKYAGYLDITPTTVKNEIERKKAIFHLSKINNAIATYSKNTKEPTVESSLLDDIKYKNFNVKSKLGLNEEVDNIKLGLMLDDLLNYNISNINLNKLYYSFDQTYDTYDNKFDFVDEDLLKEKIKSTIKLSYTSLSTFYKCKFRYFLERVLYLKHEKDTKAIMIGNIFHGILEKYGTKGFDLEATKEQELSKIEDLSVKFYFEKLWPDFLLAIEMIDKFKSSTQLVDELHEAEVNLDLSNDYLTRIVTGKIDKIIYKDIDGVNYVSIIDYKTGKDIATLDNVDDGLSLQLPIYAYFLAKTEILKNPKILGIYLNRILNDVKSQKNKDIISLKFDALKLDGYSITDKSNLAILDPTYTDSSYIKSLKVKKDGDFYQYSKVFTEKDVNDLIRKVEELIEKAFMEIESGLFDINPKKIKDKNKSCEYCPYINICFRKEKDIEEIEEKKFSRSVGE